MTHWKNTSIAEIGRIVTGKTPPTNDEDNYGGDVPFVTPTDMDGRRKIDRTLRYLTAAGAASVSSSRLPRPSVAVSCIGSDMGKAVLLPQGCVTNQQINAIIVNDENDRLFIYYNLIGRRSEIRDRAGGAAQPIMNKTDFGRLPIFIPPLEEQAKISSVLGALDDKIDLNRRTNETLEAIAREIFKYWFVDFGPVRAKMEGRDPPGLTSENAALFPDRLGADGLPYGWTFVPMAEALRVLETGSRPKGGVKNIQSGIPSVGAESVAQLGVFDFSRTKYVPESYFSAMSRGIVEDRDIILYKDGGRPGLFEPKTTIFGEGFPFEKLCINEHVYRMQANYPFSQEYLIFYFNSDSCMNEMRKRGTGVAIPGLNSSNVRALTCLHPGCDVLTAYTAVTKPIITKILSNAVQSLNLARIRDLLLPKLMSGEFLVRDAEKLVERAV